MLRACKWMGLISFRSLFYFSFITIRALLCRTYNLYGWALNGGQKAELSLKYMWIIVACAWNVAGKKLHIVKVIELNRH